MATKKVNLTLEEQIGFSAGEIYNYLHQNEKRIRFKRKLCRFRFRLVS